MRGLIKAFLIAFVAGLMSSAYAAGDMKRCEKLTGAAKEKCMAEESKK